MVLDKREPRVNTDTPTHTELESAPGGRIEHCFTDRPISRARTEMPSLQSGSERQHDEVELLDDDLVVEDEGISLASLTSAIAPRRTLRKPQKIAEPVRVVRSAPVAAPSSPPTVPLVGDSPAAWEDSSFTSEVPNVPPPARVPVSTWDDQSLTNQVAPAPSGSAPPKASVLPPTTPGSGPRAVTSGGRSNAPGSRLPTVNPPRFARAVSPPARATAPSSEPLADLWDEPPVDRRQERTQPLVTALAAPDPDAAETEVFNRGSAPQLAQLAGSKKASAPVGIPPYFVAGGRGQGPVPGMRASGAGSSSSRVAPLATHVRPQEPTVIVLRDKSKVTWALASAGLGAFAAVVAMLAVGPAAPPPPAPAATATAPAPQGAQGPAAAVTLGAVAPRPTSPVGDVVVAPTHTVTAPLVAVPAEIATTPPVSLPPTGAQEPRTVSFGEGEGVAIAAPSSQVQVPWAPPAPAPTVAATPRARPAQVQPAATVPVADTRSAPAPRPESKPAVAPTTPPVAPAAPAAPAGRRLTPEQELAEAQLKASMR